MNLKGAVGEGQVIKELNKLPRNQYYILNDLLLENKGYYFQIDHIVISIYGIFLIETKNWSGKLYGDEYNKTWKKYVNGKEINVYNPINQNWTHKKNFLSLLENELENIPVRSLIVFTGECDFSKVFSQTPLVKINKLIGHLNSYKSVVMTEDKAHELFTIINDLNILDENKRREHIGNIEENKVISTSYQNSNQRNCEPSKNDNGEKIVVEKHIYYISDIKPRDIKSSILKRFIAGVIDVVPCLLFAILFAIEYSTRSNPIPEEYVELLSKMDHSFNLELLGKIFLGYLIIQLFYLFQSRSIGKRLLGLKVMDVRDLDTVSPLRMIIRETIGKMLSASFYYIGFIIILITRNNQGLHDKLVKSFVVDMKKYEKVKEKC